MFTMRRESNRPTVQHYVPQFLLRGFAAPQTEQVYVFDKQTEKSFRSSVRNLACERGFYDIEDEDVRDGFDRWLGQFEEHAAPIINTLCDGESLQGLGSTEREWVASFIALQQVRTRRNREMWADVNKQMADALREMGAEPNQVRNFREFTLEENRRNAITDMPVMALNLVPHILKKEWLLLSVPSGEAFWIGDHPVILANNANPGDGICSTIGFAVPGIEIYVPISSRLTLGCLCPTIRDMFAVGKAKASDPMQRKVCDEFLDAFAGNKALVLNSENVKYHNSLQVGNAERFLFAAHDDFSMARELIAGNPRLKTGPRLEIVGRPRR
jgi:hypothetical protein